MAPENQGSYLIFYCKALCLPHLPLQRY